MTFGVNNMIKSMAYIFIFICCFVSNCISEDISGFPIKFISGCELDFNADKVPDKILQIESMKGVEIIALISENTGYKYYLITTAKCNMFMTCHSGQEVRETLAGKGERAINIHNTNGTYILLTQPESSSVAYFWKDNKFKEVWISD